MAWAYIKEYCRLHPKFAAPWKSPPITAPRIKLTDGKYLAYKEHGVPKDKAKYKLRFLQAQYGRYHRIISGNTSSSSLWYELNYIETKGKTKKGDRIWQIAFGSGFKCNNTVRKCDRPLKATKVSPWLDCIDRYPVYIRDVVKL